MSLPVAYLGVILIWSTTPLAIQWSGEGGGFLFGVTARMFLGAVLAAALLSVLRQGLPMNASARRTYFAAGMGIYLAMLCVYWAAQFIPSGWVSVIFGLSPILTGVMAGLWLAERSFTADKLVGMLLGLAGLVVIFGRSLELGQSGIYGIAGMLASVSMHSASAVWVKRLNPGLSGLSVTTGGLLVAAPCFVLTWWLVDGHLPVALTPRASLSIGYLALFGSVLGFAMYYYVLRHMEAGRVALITLITPVIALFYGHVFNAEPLDRSVYLGTVLILGGLGAYQWGERAWRLALARGKSA